MAKLAGAIHGQSAIPLEWLDCLALKSAIENKALYCPGWRRGKHPRRLLETALLEMPPFGSKNALGRCHARIPSQPRRSVCVYLGTALSVCIPRISRTVEIFSSFFATRRSELQDRYTDGSELPSPVSYWKCFYTFEEAAGCGKEHG